MTSSPTTVIIATIVLIAASAFFVIIEFSLLAARRHRLEEQARTRLSARAALRGMNELTLMLAVAQFGITICTFALGSVTKPAVDAWLSPVFADWGASLWLADTAAFVLALLFVTFLHLVVGEMAPKSWAIAHPEFAAGVTAIPARIIAWLLRPVLTRINRIANRLVAASGVAPAESRSPGGQDLDTIRQLVEHSAAVGTLDDSFRSQLAHVFDLERLCIRDLLPLSAPRPTAVPESATVAEVRAAAAESGHLRILVEHAAGTPGVIHVRDVLTEPADRHISEWVRLPLRLQSDDKVYDALARMRAAGEQFAVVTHGETFAGVITIADVVRRVLPHGSSLKL